MNKIQENKVIEIIIEMIKKDEHTIAAEIVSEVERRLGISLSKDRISSLRRKIGLGSTDLFFKRMAKNISHIINGDQKNNHSDSTF